MFEPGNYRRRKRMRRHACKGPGLGLKSWADPHLFYGNHPYSFPPYGPGNPWGQIHPGSNPSGGGGPLKDPHHYPYGGSCGFLAQGVVSGGNNPGESSSGGSGGGGGMPTDPYGAGKSGDLLMYNQYSPPPPTSTLAHHHHQIGGLNGSGVSVHPGFGSPSSAFCAHPSSRAMESAGPTSSPLTGVAAAISSYSPYAPNHWTSSCDYKIS
eukprot:TRINITY_DN11939_c0_g1_i1.p1 TRINITY_DN11939_c0_g1~~TRINITY_DN11939_c0_g1_i1.p1  ORF type:complete len:240 (-),score=75.41 TRINITY_DN11939_c0_g1_i1:162-791(-)